MHKQLFRLSCKLALLKGSGRIGVVQPALGLVSVGM
jgi:hypothetical protein